MCRHRAERDLTARRPFTQGVPGAPFTTTMTMRECNGDNDRHRWHPLHRPGGGLHPRPRRTRRDRGPPRPDRTTRPGPGAAHPPRPAHPDPAAPTRRRRRRPPHRGHPLRTARHLPTTGGCENLDVETPTCPPARSPCASAPSTAPTTTSTGTSRCCAGSAPVVPASPSARARSCSATCTCRRPAGPDRRRARRSGVHRGRTGHRPRAAARRRTLAAAGATADLVRVPDEVLPADLRATGAIPQHLLVDSSRFTAATGWRCTDPDTAGPLGGLAPGPSADDDFTASAGRVGPVERSDRTVHRVRR
jgi:hypothetical protein